MARKRPAKPRRKLLPFNVARARGMAQVAKDTGLGRESLYKALAPGVKLTAQAT